jgi:hypothetical protein
VSIITQAFYLIIDDSVREIAGSAIRASIPFGSSRAGPRGRNTFQQKRDHPAGCRGPSYPSSKVGRRRARRSREHCAPDAVDVAAAVTGIQALRTSRVGFVAADMPNANRLTQPSRGDTFDPHTDFGPVPNPHLRALSCHSVLARGVKLGGYRAGSRLDGKARKVGQEAKAFIAAERTRPMGPDHHLEHIAIDQAGVAITTGMSRVVRF